MVFNDRRQAGKQLAGLLSSYQQADNTLILALPRGGLPVADEMAKALQLPMDIFLVRKLGVPGHEELAFGAICQGGGQVFNDEVVRMHGLSDAVKQAAVAEQKLELQRRNERYRQGYPSPILSGKTVILVDDGIATGATMRAAIAGLKTLGVAKIVVAVPVAAADSLALIESQVDEVFCLDCPAFFAAVGQFYRHFPQLSDTEARLILQNYLVK